MPPESSRGREALGGAKGGQHVGVGRVAADVDAAQPHVVGTMGRGEQARGVVGDILSAGATSPARKRKCTGCREPCRAYFWP